MKEHNKYDVSLCIADITVSIPPGSLPFKEFLKVSRIHKVNDAGKREATPVSNTIYNMPVLMRGGEFPSEGYMLKYIQKHFPNLPKGKYKYVAKFDNVKFSSKIRYDFKD